MKRDTDHLSKPEIRLRAENFLIKNATAVQSTPPADIQHLVEELRIHQVELEMQNEELRRAQLELSEVRDRYVDLYDFAPIGYFTIGKTGLIEQVNLTGAKMLGIERGRLINQPFSVFVTADSQDDYYLYRNELFETGTRQTCELNLKKQAGGILHAQLESIVVKETEADGRCIRAAITDISCRWQVQREKANLQAQLQQAQKMEAVGTLAGGVAHDFNNLLQAVQGFTEILLFDRQKNDPGYSELIQISHAAKRGAELTRQLLTFSRKIESKLLPIDLNVLVEKTKSLLERTLPGMIGIKLHLAPESLVINADSSQIEQIIINLAVNAKDAMPEGGELTIQTANTWLDEAYCRIQPEMKPGKYILLKVSDTGCGINKETLGLIFDPFFTTKGLAEGTGLGLSMVFGIVKSHGGQIDCQSEPGVGTSFNICLPALDRKAGSDRNAEKKLPRGCNETILLVDDEEIIRDVGETTLTRFGYTVMTAEDGEVAVDRYGSEQEQIDLVLLDLVMPGMGGKKCLEALLRINPAVKVIIASGYSESEHRADLIRFGAKGFVGKPYTASTLLSTVREVLDEE